MNTKKEMKLKNNKSILIIILASLTLILGLIAINKKDEEIIIKNNNNDKILNEYKKNINDIKNNTDILVKNTNAKLSTIIALIAAVATIIGTISTIVGIIISNRNSPPGGISPYAPTATPAPSYTIYLYPEYKKLKIGAETDITATLNFDTDFVSINAYLNSSPNGETVKMVQKTSSEWQAKIYFEETGIFEVIATATAPDGTIIEGTVEIEVISGLIK